jgi:hypothetical protein
MRVLVVGTLGSSIERTHNALHDAGHEVARCHAPGQPAFPCVALETGACPLEVAPVDVVVAARDHTSPRPSLAENGVTCALRHSVPLVVAGRGPNPYARWTNEAVEDPEGVVEACERAATAPLELQSAVATTAALGVVERSGEDADLSLAGATVWRERGRLRAVLRLPVLSHKVASNVIAKVESDLRAADRFALGIDVSVEVV